MHKELYSKEPHLHIYFLPIEHLLLADWVGKTSRQTTVRGFEKYLEAFEKFACGKIMVDLRHGIDNYERIQDWLQEHWLPKAANFGLEQMALVHPPATFNQTEIGRFDLEAALARGKVQIRNFKDRTPARDWLLNE